MVSRQTNIPLQQMSRIENRAQLPPPSKNFVGVISFASAAPRGFRLRKALQAPTRATLPASF